MQRKVVDFSSLKSKINNLPYFGHHLVISLGQEVLTEEEEISNYD